MNDMRALVWQQQFLEANKYRDYMSQECFKNTRNMLSAVELRLITLFQHVNSGYCPA
uniref:Uncharacterized protein n=1 Tax=Tetraselmis sp. GSL018 TaxID=582737 RepID=A0A061QP62_9CHLO